MLPRPRPRTYAVRQRRERARAARRLRGLETPTTPHLSLSSPRCCECPLLPPPIRRPQRPSAHAAPAPSPLSQQIIIALVVVAKVGAWFSLLTLLYLGAVVAIGWPPVYKKYQHEIDDIYGAGKKFVQDQLKAVPGFVPKAEIAKKAQ